jgi:AcrR family transcriptional regulator
LAVSAELFADRGFVAVGIDDIAARVGVTGPAIYRHFESKDALFAAVLEGAMSDFASALEGATNDPSYTLESVVQAIASRIADNPEAITAYLHERWRLDRPSPSMLEAERCVHLVWGSAVAKHQPDLEKLRVEVRQRALVGALAFGARYHRGVSRSRLDELFVASGVAIMNAEQRLANPGPDSSPVPRWRPADTRRDAILHAALALFRARGVRDVGIDEIGVAAGISGPTVYYYFKNKAQVVLDAFDQAGGRVAAGVTDALSAAISPTDALERLIRSYVTIATDSVDLNVLTSREGDAILSGELKRFRRRGRAIRDGWASVVQEVRPDLTESEARLLVRMVFPLMQHAAEAAEGHGNLTEELVGIATAHLIM